CWIFCTLNAPVSLIVRPSSVAIASGTSCAVSSRRRAVMMITFSGVAPGAIIVSRGAISFGDIAVVSWANAGDARIALAAIPVIMTTCLFILGSLTVLGQGQLERS